MRYNSLLIIFLWMAGCSQKNLIEIVQTDFEEEITPQKNLTFTFNQAMVGDSLLNVWDTTSYVNFTPAVEGKFKWVSPRELVFSPVKGFLPSTDYEASLRQENIKKLVSGKTAVDKNSVVKFHTSYLKLENVHTFWAQDDRRTNQLRMNLDFNYKVNPKSLQELLTADASGQVIPTLRVLNNEPSEVVEVVIEEVGNLELDDKVIHLTLAPGVRCAESNYTTKKALTYASPSPNKNRLNVEKILPEYENNKGQIRVQLSQSVSLTQILNNLKTLPRIVYEVQVLDDGFIMRGNFESGGNYTIKLNDDMQGVFGATLDSDYEETVTFGDVKPFISFISSKGLYLSNKGEKNIGIRINNVPKVQVVVHKIYENNLIHFLKRFDYFYDNSSSYSGSMSDFGDMILNREYDTKTLPLVNDFRVLNMDFEEVGDTKGIYAIQVFSTEDQWLNSSRVVSVSDIGFIAKETEEDILVFTNSLMSAKAMKGVKVGLVSQSNQIVSREATNGSGVAIFKGIKKKFPHAGIRLITATSGKDFNYMYMNRSEVDKSSFETGGLGKSASGYQAFLYGERDLYRPGETVNLNVVVRNRRWQRVGKIPVKVKFKLPNGKDLVSLRGTLNEQGAFATSVNLPDGTITGTYHAEVYTATDVLLESMPISVEEFMPDRIKVKVALMHPDYKKRFKGNIYAGDSVRTLVTATNLFGPPAANKNYQLNFSLQKRSFLPKAYKKYNFAISAGKGSSEYATSYDLDSKFTEGETDEKGMARESFLIPMQYKNLGLLQGNVYATVFDETGRSVGRSVTFDAYTQKVFLGIRELDYYVSTNRKLNIPVIALDTKEKPVSSKATLQIVRYKWQTVLEKNGSGELEYISRRKEEVLKEKEINIVGTNTVYDFTPTLSGDYEVRLRLPGAHTQVVERFYAYGYAYTSNSSFEVNKDGKVNIQLDKKKYRLGEQARILFTTPFNGRLLVTVEREKVLQQFYLETKDKSASAGLTIQKEHLPNVYITATLIKPVSDGAIPLTVAHGFEPLFTEDIQSKLNLTLEAAEKTESNKTQTIKVKTNRAEAGVEVTLAVVDEGILQLKNYKTPDPHSFFFQKRRLEVDSYDLYPQLFPEISIQKSSTGGDGGGALARSSPMVNKRVKLVRFWSGILQTNAAGEATYTINIPQFSGSLRIMAVAYKDGAFGTASKSMKVADPMVISTGLPRFLSPKDKVTIPVTLTNTTDNASEANVQIKVTNNLKILGNAKKTTRVKANGEGRVEFEIEAKAVMDSARVSVQVNTMGRTFQEKLDINIRPVAGVVKSSGSGLVKAGENKKLRFGTDFIPGTAQEKLIVSKSPMVQFSNDLEYVIQYPYGCVEQITSSVFPQLYVQDLMRVIAPAKQNINLYTTQIKENVQEGILRLLARQNYSGGLSYWSGGGGAHWFGTAYASHFMLEAQKAGYHVPQTALNQMFSYLRERVTDKGTQDYYYLDSRSRRRKKRIVPKEAVYSLYVLTLAKKQDLSMMNYYKENSGLLALDSKYLLAVSYLLLGDKDSYRELLPSGFSGEASEHVFSGSFHSYIRDEALALNALVEGDENNLQIPQMAQHLSQQVKNARYLNTQERSFTLLALGKLSKKALQNDIKGKVFAGSTLLADFQEGDIVLSKNLTGKEVQVKASGKGTLYYSWQMAGLSATGKVKEEDKQLKVRKTFYDQNGNVIRGNVFRQNDLVIVKVSIIAVPYFNNVDNVVLTDMLPAGFEIENPRLMANRSIRWIRSRDYPDYFDIRDDRINYFTTAGSKVKNFYYLVRAVTKGTFQMGPVSADAMYNGAYHSYHGAGVVKIVDRFSEAK